MRTTSSVPHGSAKHITVRAAQYLRLLRKICDRDPYAVIMSIVQRLACAVSLSGTSFLQLVLDPLN